MVCCYASKELHVCYVSFVKSSVDQNSIRLWLRLCMSGIRICVNGFGTLCAATLIEQSYLVCKIVSMNCLLFLYINVQ